MLKFKNILFLFLFFVASFQLKAQENILLQPTDSIVLSADSISLLPDSVLVLPDHSGIDIVEDSIIVLSLDSIDSSVINKSVVLSSKSFKPNPKKAVIYSAIFPGLGQIYNQKYWKLPILYGGFVGVTYAITWNNTHYSDYLAGYRSILKDDPNDTAWIDLLPYGRDPDTIDKNWFTGVLKDRKNYFRYYRDLSIIIGVALYGLGIVDAYVDAQLFEFDVSPDLSMRVEPSLIQRDFKHGFLADGIGFKWSVTF